ncbi:MAG: tetratricopeptide repeat protein, partial [Planctomycetota bacterium]
MGTKEVGISVRGIPMPGRMKNSLPKIVTLALLAVLVLFIGSAKAQLRRIKVSDKMPEFELLALSDSNQPEPNRPEPNQPTFTYRYGRKQVLVVAFLMATQKQSRRAVADIKKVVKELEGKGQTFDFVAVLPEQVDNDFLQLCKDNSKPIFDIVCDAEYQLWGRLGIIATPTLLIIGKDDRVLWIKAGYGYDFAPALRIHLGLALGILKEGAAEELVHVETLANTTLRARVRRHLMMAKMLEDKGRLKYAIAEVRKARELDPNSVDVALGLGELLCKANENQAALDVAEKIKTANKAEKARVLLISGWARRQMNELNAAEKLLLEATKSDPKSSRGFFELGKIYQTRGEVEKAM